MLPFVVPAIRQTDSRPVEHKKTIDDPYQSLVVFDFVGAEGFEPPTLCL